MVASSLLGTKRARAISIHLILVYATTAAVLLRLVNASTSVPSSSSELCPDETAACFDSPFCWDCVAQFADSSDFCEELYPVLAVDAGTGPTGECEIASALFCCSFDASGQDCVGDEITMDFFRCGLLEENGCLVPESPCSGVSDNTDGNPATPAPARTAAPPTAPIADDSQDTTITFPAPVEDVPLPSTPSPTAVDRDAVATGAAARGAHAFCWGSYCCVVLLAGGWTAAAAAAAGVVVYL